MPVIDYYEKQGKLVSIPATGSPSEVFQITKSVFEPLFCDKETSEDLYYGSNAYCG